MNENELHFDSHRFSIQSATFRYITESISGPGWDFDFCGTCETDNEDEPEYPYGIRLMTEAGPLPLKPRDDLTGLSFRLDSPYDEESGEPYFDLNILEAHDVTELQMAFLRRQEDRYLIGINAIAADTITGKPEKLELLAWATRAGDHAYPT